MKKLTPKATPTHLQIVFTATAIVATLFFTAQTLYYALMQYSSNPNLSGFMGQFIQGFFYPLLITVFAFFLITRAIPMTQKVFESVIVGIAASLAMAFTETILMMTISSAGTYEKIWTTLGPEMYWLASGLPAFLLVLLYLLLMRRRKQW